MTDRLGKQEPLIEAAVLSEIRAHVRDKREKHDGGIVEVDGQLIKYDLYSVDARTDQERARDAQRGRLEGPVAAILPGHGQTIRGTRKLTTAAGFLSRAKLAWCVNVIPARGGDPVEGRALIEIVRQRLADMFPAGEADAGASHQQAEAILMGWSHGGGEALRTVIQEPSLFPKVVGLCPTSLVDRHPLELIGSFLMEAARIAWAGITKADWGYVRDTMRVGSDLVIGIVRDLWRSRSPRRLINDVLWASRWVTDRTAGYPGEVVLLLGEQDSVIRWRDVFPACEHPGEIPAALPAFKTGSFGQAKSVEFVVVEGNHIAPEAASLTWMRLALDLLGQFDESAKGTPPQAT